MRPGVDSLAAEVVGFPPDVGRLSRHAQLAADGCCEVALRVCGDAFSSAFTRKAPLSSLL